MTSVLASLLQVRRLNPATFGAVSRLGFQRRLCVYPLKEVLRVTGLRTGRCVHLLPLYGAWSAIVMSFTSLRGLPAALFAASLAVEGAAEPYVVRSYATDSARGSAEALATCLRALVVLALQSVDAETSAVVGDLVFACVWWWYFYSLPASDTETRDSDVRPKTLWMVAGQKLLTQESTSLIAVWLYPTDVLGIWGFVCALGGLPVRTLFATLEDSATVSIHTVPEKSIASAQRYLTLEGSIGLLGMVVGAAVAPSLIRLLFGDKWEVAAPSLQLYCVVLAVMSIAGSLDIRPTIVADDSWLASKIRAQRVTLGVVGCVMLAGRPHIYSLALAELLTHLSTALVAFSAAGVRLPLRLWCAVAMTAGPLWYGYISKIPDVALLGLAFLTAVVCWWIVWNSLP
ncbi:MAG: hypothetical protein KVP17_002707 [Porospora cf. gigantea B]|uniref:uncharacterized protein n=2 Tax=Porospora cf. gigantea B TaxID=2853592 RepID=UPI003571C3D0|nr:MAG: hypothetical protein KVP17_002707 [Porospora cf. gigantea B]